MCSDDLLLLERQAASDPHPAILDNVYRGDSPDMELMTRIATTWSLVCPDHDWTSGQELYHVVRTEDAAGDEDANTVVLAGAGAGVE